MQLDSNELRSLLIRFFGLWCLCAGPLYLGAQAPTPEPGVQNLFFEPRPKILEFSMWSLPYNRDIQLHPTQELTNLDVERNNINKVKLNLPVLWKDKFKMYAKLGYQRETLHLVTAADVPQPQRLRFYQTDLSLRYQIDLNDSEFLMGYVGGRLRSDRLDWSDITYAVSLGWGKTINANKKFAAGFGVENAWGRWRFSPVLLYENRINEKWDLSLLLPRRAKLSYYVNPGFHLIAEARGSSVIYRVDHQQLLPEHPVVEYRQRRAVFKIGLEKQLYDWFWVGAHAGVVTPLNSVLVLPGEPTRNHIFDFNATTDRFLMFSVFIVPPQKLFDKLTK